MAPSVKLSNRSICNSEAGLGAVPNRPGARPVFGRKVSQKTPKACPNNRRKARQGFCQTASKNIPKPCPKIGPLFFVFAILSNKNGAKSCPKKHRLRRQLFGRKCIHFRALVHSILGVCAIGVRGLVHSGFGVGRIHVSGLAHSRFAAWCTRGSWLDASKNRNCRCPPPRLSICPKPVAKVPGRQDDSNPRRRAAGSGCIVVHS